MIRFAPCKINLGLHVTEKRNDGYHNLETCFYPLPFTDVVEVLPAKESAFVSSGLAIPGHAADNLCLRAYHLLATKFSLPPVHLHLHKVIPTGAGLGGGSSDAAHVLRALNELFTLHLTPSALEAYAQQLGSDCAFFLYDVPLLGTGRGEILSPLQLRLRDYFLVLIKPEVHVSTAVAYGNVQPMKPALSVKEILEQHPLETWKDVLKNDFEKSVFAAHPIIQEYKENLYAQGALYASMSGSGSAVFGIFKTPVVYTGPDLLWSGNLIH